MDENLKEQRSIRLLIAESQNIVMQALILLVESIGGIEIAGTAVGGDEVLQALVRAKPDVVLLDIRKPGPSKIEVTRNIDEKMPWVRVISLSDNTHPVYIREMLKHGAKGFLTRDCTRDELRESIQKVYEGKTFFCNASSRTLLREMRPEESPGTPDLGNVTHREIEILGYIADGRSTREISEKLFISTATVERHKSNLLKKLNLRNTAHLVRVAVENGLLIS